MLFLLALNSNLQDKTFFSVKTKINLDFTVEVYEKSKRSFFFPFDKSPCSSICTQWKVQRLTFCAGIGCFENIWEKSEVAKVLFHQMFALNWAKLIFFPCEYCQRSYETVGGNCPFLRHKNRRRHSQHFRLLLLKIDSHFDTPN